MSYQNPPSSVPREWTLHPVVVLKRLPIIQIHVNISRRSLDASRLDIGQHLPRHDVIHRLALVIGQMEQFLIRNIERNIPERDPGGLVLECRDHDHVLLELDWIDIRFQL